jgi:hypothetical protein
MLKEYFWAFLFSLIVLPGMISCSQTMDESEARKILNEFYTDNVPESINDRHLLNAGKAIVPYLIDEIQKEDMPKRGYAVLALGKIGDRRALPVLIRMFENPTERGVHPSDSLRAIWHIDRKLGEELASKYTGGDEFMKRTIELLRKGVI